MNRNHFYSLTALAVLLAFVHKTCADNDIWSKKTCLAVDPDHPFVSDKDYIRVKCALVNHDGIGVQLTGVTAMALHKYMMSHTSDQYHKYIMKLLRKIRQFNATCWNYGKIEENDYEYAARIIRKGFYKFQDMIATLFDRFDNKQDLGYIYVMTHRTKDWDKEDVHLKFTTYDNVFDTEF